MIRITFEQLQKIAQAGGICLRREGGKIILEDSIIYEEFDLEKYFSEVKNVEIYFTREGGVEVHYGGNDWALRFDDRKVVVKGPYFSIKIKDSEVADFLRKALSGVPFDTVAIATVKKGDKIVSSTKIRNDAIEVVLTTSIDKDCNIEIEEEGILESIKATLQNLTEEEG